MLTLRVSDTSRPTEFPKTLKLWTVKFPKSKMCVFKKIYICVCKSVCVQIQLLNYVIDFYEAMYERMDKA